MTLQQLRDLDSRVADAMRENPASPETVALWNQWTSAVVSHGRELLDVAESGRFFLENHTSAENAFAAKNALASSIRRLNEVP